MNNSQLSFYGVSHRLQICLAFEYNIHIICATTLIAHTSATQFALLAINGLTASQALPRRDINIT